MMSAWVTRVWDCTPRAQDFSLCGGVSGVPEVLNPALGFHSTPGVPQTLLWGSIVFLGTPEPALVRGWALSAALGGPKSGLRGRSSSPPDPNFAVGVQCSSPPPQPPLEVPDAAWAFPIGPRGSDGLRAGRDGQPHGGMGRYTGKQTERCTQECVRGWADRRKRGGWTEVEGEVWAGMDRYGWLHRCIDERMDGQVGGPGV